MTLSKTKNSSEILNYLIVIYAFLLPISRAGIVLFTALIFIVWLLKSPIKDNIKFLFKSKFVVVFLLFVTYSFIGLLWSSNLDEGINYAIRYWYYLPMFIIAANLKKEYLNATITAFLLSMFISEVLSFGMFFELIEIKNQPSPFPTPFMHHIQYSVFIVFTSLFLLNKIYYTDILKYKIMYGIFFITVTINIFINGGRTGYIVFFITIFIVVFLNIQNRLKAIFITLFLIISSMTLAYNYSPTFGQRVQDSKVEIKEIIEQKFNTSVGQRIAMYYMGGQIIYKNPIFGVGTGDEMDVLKDIIDTEHPQLSSIKELRHFHSVLLHTAVQLGLLGLILQILIFYHLYKIKIKTKFYQNTKYIFATIFLLASFSGNMFHQQFTMAVFALIVGILLAVTKHEQEE